VPSAVRLFVGIPLDAPGLAAPARDLQDAVPDAKVVPPRKRHVTLRFLGDIADTAPVEAALRAALRGTPAVAGTLLGVGAFPDARRARVAWAGVQAPGLADVALRVRHATRDLGVPESHPFTAHLTLARLPGPRDLSGWCARHAGQPWGTFEAQAVLLCRSQAGAYEALADIPLGEPTAP
jgi:2'-5' RNA ligase